MKMKIYVACCCILSMCMANVAANVYAKSNAYSCEITDTASVNISVGTLLKCTREFPSYPDTTMHLENNSITNIRAQAFEGLYYLTTLLDMRFNALTTIGAQSFVGLSQLTELRTKLHS
eukprot:m.269297 g.269297  ORF g.269297 m.269297 type:complete len:119 (-) comp83459_c0_seq1:459-815(-)